MASMRFSGPGRSGKPLHKETGWGWQAVTARGIMAGINHGADDVSFRWPERLQVLPTGTCLFRRCLHNAKGIGRHLDAIGVLALLGIGQKFCCYYSLLRAQYCPSLVMLAPGKTAVDVGYFTVAAGGPAHVIELNFLEAHFHGLYGNLQQGLPSIPCCAGQPREPSLCPSRDSDVFILKTIPVLPLLTSLSLATTMRAMG